MVAKISHFKTTMESFRQARVVPELYLRARENGIICFAFVFTAKLEGKLQEPRLFLVACGCPAGSPRRGPNHPVYDHGSPGTRGFRRIRPRMPCCH